MNRFNLPEPLSDKSISVLLNLTALYVSLVNHPGHNHELVIPPRHLAFLLSPNFPPLFHLQRVHRLLPIYCSGDKPLAIGSGISTFLCKTLEPPPWQFDALSSSPSSSISSIAGRIPCGAAPFTPTCTRRLHVRNDIIWQKTAAYGELPTHAYGRPSQMCRLCCKPCYLLCLLLGIRRRLPGLFVGIRWLLFLVSLPCDPMALPVYPTRNSMAPLVFLPRDPAASPVSPPRDPAAPPVSPPRGPAAPSVSPYWDPATAPPPLPVRRVPKPLFSD